MSAEVLALIKPDAVRLEVWLEIIRIYEGHGFSVKQTKLMSPMPRPLAEEFYTEHRGRDFYPRLIDFMTSGQTIALRLVGIEDMELDGMIDRIRVLNGATDPRQAATGTIRRYFGLGLPNNAVHGSADSAAASRELALIFGNC
ncbi:MAG: nucleoside-diphosphate kinase [Candidatus Vogelbacteria bacterium]|nr:nucleoside-diphosphate kinase [Candidatus Vogelbacteria bacterium]